MSQVIIIGGGAAGMMAAIAAAGAGHKVCIYEKNEKLGKKIYITGKGRCNVTNACDTEESISKLPTSTSSSTTTTTQSGAASSDALSTLKVQLTYMKNQIDDEQKGLAAGIQAYTAGVGEIQKGLNGDGSCLLYTSPSPRDA